MLLKDYFSLENPCRYKQAFFLLFNQQQELKKFQMNLDWTPRLKVIASSGMTRAYHAFLLSLFFLKE